MTAAVAGFPELDRAAVALATIAFAIAFPKMDASVAIGKEIDLRC